MFLTSLLFIEQERCDGIHPAEAVEAQARDGRIAGRAGVGNKASLSRSLAISRAITRRANDPVFLRSLASPLLPRMSCGCAGVTDINAFLLPRPQTRGNAGFMGF